MIKKIRRKTLPALSPKAPAELRPLFAAMAEILETGEGVRGDKLDRKLTLRDMLDGGLAKLKVPGNPDAGLTLPSGSQNMAAPPRPTGFAADGSFFGMIHLSWEPPQEQYNNHAVTNIYRSEEDNFATAEIVGREPGMFYSDIVRNDVTIVDDPLNLPGYYYWISFVSESNVEGPPNSPSGTFAQPIPDAAYLLGQLSEQLGESELESNLRERLNGIESNQSSIEQQQVVVQGLSAQYTIKTDVNGYVAGYGVYNDGKVADFAVLADRFWIAQPGKPASAIKPFMIVNGKTYIDSAFIRDASIQEGKLGPITFGKIFDSAGRPVTTIGGKLRVDMIDTNSLRVNTANIVSAAITTAKIGDAQITTAKIADLSVDTLRIAGNAVTIPVTVTGGHSVMPVAGIYLDYAGDIQITGYFVLANRGGDVGSFMEIQEQISGVWTPIKVAGERINGDSTNSAIIVTTVRKQAGAHHFRLWLKRHIPPYDNFSSYSESATITLMGVKR